MPSKSEKQRKFFGAVMGAKKGKGKVKGAAKKVAKEMPEKEIKKFLKKEQYDDIVNAYLKTYLIESPVVEYVEAEEGKYADYEQALKMITMTMFGGNEEEAKAYLDKHPEAINDILGYDADMRSGAEDEEITGDEEDVTSQEQPTQPEEDYEEECEHAAQGCMCGGCPACEANKEKASGGEAPILKFYGFSK